MKINKLPLLLDFKKAWQNLSIEKQKQVVEYLDAKIYSDNQCSRYAQKKYEQMAKMIWPYVDTNVLEQYQQSDDAYKMYLKVQKKFGINEKQLTSTNFFALIEGAHSHNPKNVDKQYHSFQKLKDKFDNMLDKNSPYLDLSVAMSATTLAVSCLNLLIVEQQKQKFYDKVSKFINEKLKNKNGEITL